MIVAVDRHGTLTQTAVANLVRSLQDAGHEIHIVSHVNHATEQKCRDATFYITRLCERHGIRPASIRAEDYSATGKVPRLKEIGAHLFIDDHPNTVRQAEQAGIPSICVRHPDAPEPK